MNIFKKLFGKKDKSANTTKSLIEQICVSMDLLLYKSGNLNSQFEEEKNTISKLAEDVKTIIPVEEIFGAKLEQEILRSITSVSFACDSALAGSNVEQVKKSLSTLSSQISQRVGLQSK